MEHKIAELTEKIYQEAIIKGEQKSQEIIQAAHQQAASLLSDAKKEAQQIINQAQKQAQELQHSILSEIKLASQQALSSLKQQIIDSILTQTVSHGITDSLSNPSIILECIFTALQSWKPGSSTPVRLDIILPDNMQKNLSLFVEKAAQKSMHENLTFSFSKTFKAGFQIKPHGSLFKISLTDDDFIHFFKDFLRPKTRAFLFSE